MNLLQPKPQLWVQTLKQQKEPQNASHKIAPKTLYSPKLMDQWQDIASRWTGLFNFNLSLVNNNKNIKTVVQANHVDLKKYQCFLFSFKCFQFNNSIKCQELTLLNLCLWANITFQTKCISWSPCLWDCILVSNRSWQTSTGRWACSHGQSRELHSLHQKLNCISFLWTRICDKQFGCKQWKAMWF